MDIEEWELLPNDGHIEIHDAGEKKIYSSKFPTCHIDDLKADKPNSNSSKGIKPQPAGAGVPQFEENKQPPKESRADSHKVLKQNSVQLALGESEEVGLSLWKWSLTGIGAICSFGVAAASVCIIIFSSHQKNKSAQQNQKLENYSHIKDQTTLK